MALTPRYKPSWLNWAGNSQAETLIGYIDDLDVYYEKSNTDPTISTTATMEEHLYVVGPIERALHVIDGCAVHNFDAYRIEDNRLTSVLEEDAQDIHMSLSDLCQLYQLAVDHGYITNEEQDGIPE